MGHRGEEEIIVKLKSLLRYEPESSGHGIYRCVNCEACADGRYVHWEDIEKIIKDHESRH